MELEIIDSAGFYIANSVGLVVCALFVWIVLRRADEAGLDVRRRRGLRRHAELRS